MSKESFENSKAAYRNYLLKKELSSLTVVKYISDAQRFYSSFSNKEPTFEDVLEYKKQLMLIYKSSTVNSYLISLNNYFHWLGRDDLRINLIKLQKSYFYSKEMTVNDYNKMLEFTLSYEKEYKWYLIMKCLGGLGIRVGELKFISLESVEKGYAEIYFKSKLRTILFPDALRKLLIAYCKKERILSGCIFLNKKRSAPMDTSVIWRNLKRIAERSDVDKELVYPHNFRHMFARIYMNIYHNIVDLADILGHSSIETTRIYTRSSQESQRNRLDNLGL